MEFNRKLNILIRKEEKERKREERGQVNRQEFEGESNPPEGVEGIP